MKKLMVALLLVCQVGLAADDVKYLKTNEPAPFSGYLITAEKVQKIHDIQVERDSYMHINKLMGEENAIIEARLKNSQVQADALSKRLIETKDNEFLKSIGFFVLGAVITGGIAYGATRAVAR